MIAPVVVGKNTKSATGKPEQTDSGLPAFKSPGGLVT